MQVWLACREPTSLEAAMLEAALVEAAMLGAAMFSLPFTLFRWTRRIVMAPSRAFAWLYVWTWRTFDDTGATPPKAPKHAAATTSLAIAAGATTLAFADAIEPWRALMLWFWFTVVGIVASVIIATRKRHKARLGTSRKPSQTATPTPAPISARNANLKASIRQAAKVMRTTSVHAGVHANAAAKVLRRAWGASAKRATILSNDAHHAWKAHRQKQRPTPTQPVAPTGSP